VTRNRRADISPYVNSSSIDPNMGVFRIDDSNGNAMATLFNFAIHGTCYGPDNMGFSSDIMGTACDTVESMGGGIGMFVNGDAGDISPASGSCDNAPNFSGGVTMGQTAMSVRNSIKTATIGTIKTATNTVQFGQVVANWTLARELNCTSGGPLNICTICAEKDCDWNLPGGPGLVEEDPRFTAVSFSILGENTLFVSQPGESLLELGNQIRADSAALGFNRTFLFGYTNSYLMYFCPPDEYVIGGYECNLTLWGIGTSDLVRKGGYNASSQIAPKAASTM